MILSSRPFRRISILGVGMIGGSLGLSIKKHKLAKEVVGVSFRQSSLVNAMKIGAIDIAETEPEKAVRNADLVILATPVDVIMKLLPRIKGHVRRGCIVTDVGSTKTDIVETAMQVLPYPNDFIGSHPLTGSEKKGAENSCEDLFDGKTCILTPVEETSRTVKTKIRMFWTSIGMKIKVMSPLEHDQALSYVSHLPHVTAYALMDTVPESVLELASSGLKDTTRIAASTPEMWRDICFSNPSNIVKNIDEMVAKLSSIRQAIVQRDDQTLLDLFVSAKKKRDLLNG